jgi:uncharacterized repeat protein (TIGR03803 family)
MAQGAPGRKDSPQPLRSRRNVIRLVSVALCAITFAACSQAPGFVPQRNAQQGNRGAAAPASAGYQSLYAFKGATDGDGPAAGLIALNGTLYGTTQIGGDIFGYGTVFAINASGQERVLYRFKGGRDGAFPAASLIAVNGTLYGATLAGGTNHKGTIFAITTSGAERVIYNFRGVPDAQQPNAGLIALAGKLYGTASGGANGRGAIFSVNTSGRERVLYSFDGGSGGAYPQASLLAVNGVLYGTADAGGKNANCNLGCGTVFSVTPAGKQTVLYRFKGGLADGASPKAPLTAIGNALYGTTFGGGSALDGTVFSITLSGRERVLHSFTGFSTNDGGYPSGGLTAVGTTLYGATSAGGVPNNGTIFAVSASGQESVLYVFHGGGYPIDGAAPESALIALNGVLYGTTSTGGNSFRGTVFSYTP